MNGSSDEPVAATNEDLRAAMLEALARRQAALRNDGEPAADGEVVARPAPGVTNAVIVDGAFYYTGPPGPAMEKGGTLVVDKSSGRSRIVGYQDDRVRASVPRSRPRERRAAGAKDSSGGSRGGDSGDGSRSTGDKPRPSADDEEDDPPGVAVPALVVRLPLEGRIEARYDGPPGDPRLDDWLRASVGLLELAAFALSLREALARVDEEVDR